MDPSALNHPPTTTTHAISSPPTKMRPGPLDLPQELPLLLGKLIRMSTVDKVIYGGLVFAQVRLAE